VQVEDGESLLGVLGVIAGKIDEDGAVLGVGQDGGVEAIAFEAGEGRW
jgi:hypothetical protein